MALAASAGLTVLIILGSRNLEHYDAALFGYTVASVVALGAVVFRYAIWLQRPATRVYWRRGFHHQRSKARKRSLLAPLLNFHYPSTKDSATLVRTLDGELHAFGQKCTHLSCPVYFERAHQRFECPCHDGAFDAKTGNDIRAENLHLFPALAHAPASRFTGKGGLPTSEEVQNVLARLRSDHDFFMKELAQTIKVMREIAGNQPANLEDFQELRHA